MSAKWWRDPWTPNRPVAETCEVIEDFSTARMCGKAAVLAYPAMGGGYMSLCDSHAENHRHYCVSIEAAKRGEQPDWSKAFASPSSSSEKTS